MIFNTWPLRNPQIHSFFSEYIHAISGSGNYFDKILDRHAGTNRIKVEGKNMLWEWRPIRRLQGLVNCDGQHNWGWRTVFSIDAFRIILQSHFCVGILSIEFVRRDETQRIVPQHAKWAVVLRGNPLRKKRVSLFLEAGHAIPSISACRKSG